jgi:hypothetical protein
MTGRHGGNEHEFNQEKRRRIQKRIRWCAACFRSAINAMIIKSKDFFSQVGARPGPAQYNDVGWFRPFSNRQGSTDCYLVDRIFQDRGGRQEYTHTNVVDIGFRVIPSRLSGILLFGRDPSPRWYTLERRWCACIACAIWNASAIDICESYVWSDWTNYIKLGINRFTPIKFAVVYRVDTSTTECRLLATLFGQSRKWHDNFYFFFPLAVSFSTRLLELMVA